MQVRISLSLPRDTASVRKIRRVLGCAMAELGMESECRSDLELALTEACSNVVRHADGSDEYEVSVTINEHVCAIDVVDTGRGYDEEALRATLPHPSAEQGRGLHLIQALADSVQLVHRSPRGTIMRFEKRLVWTH
jgi:serine/threonine-protein kinase RsbW